MASPQPLRSRPLAPDRVTSAEPLLPTVVVASWKGGAWKTSIAVALAERLAYAGLRVLLLTTDPQEDARARLGVHHSAPDGTAVQCGKGRVSVAGVKGSRVVDVLYRVGPVRYGDFDVFVVDTPPILDGGTLPGVLLVATTDGTDASNHLATMLQGTPENTLVALVRVGRAGLRAWKHDAVAIIEAAFPAATYLREPLPPSKPVKDAHDTGSSVWNLRRSGPTSEFLGGIETVAEHFWSLFRDDAFPALPARRTAEVYVPGWDDDAS
ncbi:MAG: AAA family ATPase [Armatimonadetes bacterium]|nr:AAA family ATPase [Armatimonadota bacterium]